MTSAEQLEPRVKALEIGHEVQESILTQIQAELIESERLVASVTRLGDGADALSEALMKVDAQQQTLSRLGQQLQQVKEETDTSEEVDRKLEEAREEAAKKIEAARLETARVRKQAMSRMYAGGIAALALLMVVTLGAVNAVEQSKREDEQQCLRSLRTTTAVGGFLDAVARNAIVPEIRDSANDVLAVLPPANSTAEVCKR